MEDKIVSPDGVAINTIKRVEKRVNCAIHNLFGPNAWFEISEWNVSAVDEGIYTLNFEIRCGLNPNSNAFEGTVYDVDTLIKDAEGDGEDALYFLLCGFVYAKLDTAEDGN